MAASSGLERQVAGALRRAGFSRNGATLVVGASGGPDSTALLRCLHRLRDEHALSLHVAHLNHDFRGAEADADAAFVRELAAQLGLPCTVDKQDPVQYQRERGISSFEQGAREMRYSFLARTAQAAGAAAVAVGHTADDQAETVLLHLLRGAGLHGLRGMSELAPWPWPGAAPSTATALALFRPLLNVPKADTAGYCRELGQDYRQDSGNYLWRFTRNRIRQDLMPRLAQDYNPRVGDALARLAHAAAEQVDFVERELDRAWPTLAVESPGRAELSLTALTPLHPALQRLALRRAYDSVYGDTLRLSETHLAAMMGLFQARQGGRSVDLPRGGKFRRAGDALLLTRNDAEVTPLPDFAGEYALTLPERPGEERTAAAGPWTVTMRAVPAGGEFPWAGDSRNSYVACLDWTALSRGPVTARAWLPGDRFQPSGMSGHKKLQDFFTDVKAPRELRRRTPLLVVGGRIAWVVGYRTAEWAVAGAASAPLWVRFERTA